MHSPLSILNNRFPKTQDGPDWDKYLSCIEQTDISVLGVTDYFTIEGYKRLLEFRKANRLSNIKLILPNIEFRLRDTANDKGINFHVIFSEAVPPNEIEEHFLHELHITMEGRPQAADEREKLKISVMEELGRDVRSENRERYRNHTDLQVGAMFTRIDHEEMSKLLNSKRFRGKYVLVLASDNLPDWEGPANATRRILTQKTDFAFTPNESNIDWFLGKKGYLTQAQYVAEFKSLKPSLHGCDAHRLSEINRPCTKRHCRGHDCGANPEECVLKFCWIKADPTFEGLKQVLYEPEDRVRIQATKPVPSRHIYTFQNVSISESKVGSALTMSETHLPINPGLVAVTGGKGAGKTAFVDLIANCFQDRYKSKDANSFVRRIADKQPSLLTTLSFTITDDFFKQLSEDKFIDRIDLSYISQGELDKYIEDGSALFKRVKEILFDAATREQKHDFETAENGIVDAKSKIREATATILRLDAETNDFVLNQINVRIRQAQAQLEDLARQINEQDISEEEILKAQELETALVALSDKERSVKRLIELANVAKSFIENDMERQNEAIRAINELLSTMQLDDTMVTKLEFLPDNSDNVNKLIQIADQELRTILRESESKKAERESFDSQVAQRASLLEKQREVQDAENTAFIELANVEKLNAEKQSIKALRRNTYKEMLGLVKQQDATYSEIIRTFSSTQGSENDQVQSPEGNVLKQVRFFAETQFRRDKFIKRATELFHLGRVTVDGDESDFKELFELCQDYTQRSSPNVDDICTVVEELFESPDLRERMVKAATLESYGNLLFANYFSVRPIITYKDIIADRLSVGQKATVLIKIYLKHGDNPIIIDSHDDHLDNQFIMEELIPALREAKKVRQIILVSNNANVVINSDAEQIIIAEHDQGRISYTSGSLENPDIQSKAIQVLEGGKQAFKKRQKKYRMV